MKRLNIYTRFNLSIMAFVAAGLFGMALMVSTPASATTTCAMVRCSSGTTCVETPQGATCQMNTPPSTTPMPSISCANVRCAGTCTDTAAGPVCGPRPDLNPPTLSCANVLCQSGTCVETRSGPQCVSDGVLPPKSHPPKWHSRKKWKKRRHKHKGRVCYESHWQPWEPTHNGHGSDGHSHDNNGHHSNGEAHPHPHNYPPKPLPPKPMPPQTRPGDNNQMCPMVYQPVCAEKVVQCVKAPCPPVRQTFNNSCEAQRDGYTVMRKGQCHSGYPQAPIK